jgi:hypothetical protein
MGDMADPNLPFVDEHTHDVAAPPDRTWAALSDYVVAMTSRPHLLLFRVLGTVPRSGFEIVASDPPREVVLGGRHRFSAYRLVFRVEPAEGGSRLHALTYAVFPGLRGRAYRSALMVSGGHARATRAMLQAVARRAESG